MKKHTTYFKEDIQELKTLPIVDSNCYYLGEFDKSLIIKLQRHIDKTNGMSYIALQTFVNEKLHELQYD